MGNSKAFTMWKESIIFQEGLYLYLDEQEHVSVISKERAVEYETRYYEYQARMDVDRGGVAPEIAYPGRGFVKDESGRWRYASPYNVEGLKDGGLEIPIQGEFMIPERIGVKDISYIEERAFLNCGKLTHLIMPQSITCIGAGAFAGCENLEKITLSDNINAIGEKVFDDTAFFKNEQNWENGALYLGNWLIKVDTEISGNFEVKEGIVGIADYAFAGCEKLNGVMIPDSVQYIGKFMLEGCQSLTDIKFPKKVQKFGIGVFSKCISMRKVDLPIGITNLGAMFAGGINLESITIPEGITEIGRAAFKNCVNLVSINLPDSIQMISSDAFENSGYFNDKSNWEDNVLYIGKWLIKADESVSGVYQVKEGTVGIADLAFSSFASWKPCCPNLIGIKLPDSIRYIGGAAFQGCVSLSVIEIPPQVEELRHSILRECGSLKEVRIPKSVKVLGQWVFYRCMNMERLIIENDDLEIDQAAIVNCPKLKIYAHKGSTAQEYAFKEKIGFCEKAGV